MYSHTPGSGPRAWNSTSTNPTSTPDYTEVYFSYSSNMSPQTSNPHSPPLHFTHTGSFYSNRNPPPVKGRHPHSLFAGLALLPNWRWTINTEHFANIVPSTAPQDKVYGALYFITALDESGLDDMEGAPTHYQKQHLEVTRINADGSATDQKVTALVYVDTIRTEEAAIAPEYRVWIRKAVRDAKPFGLPDGYVEEVIAPHLVGEDVEEDMEPVRVVFSRNAFDR